MPQRPSAVSTSTLPELIVQWLLLLLLMVLMTNDDSSG
jgi:hypothetical protein